ncbi:MAG TPA: uroporphyrinogen-III synthase [Planctomycetota bacterium]|nr:uroporphyrinogen-III synthase [Planctomycetota bacterium]
MPSLSGKTVVLLRAQGQGGALESELRDLGARILFIPVIAIAPPEDPRLLEEAIARRDDYDWIAFTSPNAVEAFLDRCRGPVRARLASVGPGTSDAIRERGHAVALEAKESIQEGLARALVGQGVAGKRVLLPRSAIARDALPKALEEAGARVTCVPAYRTIESETDVSPLTQALERGEVDAICFTSASTARYLARRIGEAELARRLSGTRPVVASIGPSTSAALRELGVGRVAEANDHTAKGLAATVTEALSRS